LESLRTDRRSSRAPGRIQHRIDFDMSKRKKQSTFERLKRGELSNRQRKDLVRRVRVDDARLETVHRNVAGIDIGNKSHFASVPPDRDAQPVREFGSWTAGLTGMAEWLKSCGIEKVVMQSTGVYWMAVYLVLEEHGFQVCLANARETRNLPGRKSDVQECQWLRKLHTYGLLRNSFRPPEEIRGMRSVWRLRQRHVGDAGREIQHMQKALTTMNVQLANVISDISGVSGQAIIRAILKGERNPYVLAKEKDYRVKASEEEIARSLEGTWQEEMLFELQQAVDRYDFCQRQIGECDKRLQNQLQSLSEREIGAAKESAAEPMTSVEVKERKRKGGQRKDRSKPRKNQPHFDLQGELERICGVDLTTIDGVDVMTVQTFISELGVDMRAWATEDHLVSWLKLAPNRQITGGKVIRTVPLKTKSRASEALRMAASTLVHSDSYLGARYRHLRARLGPAKATKAMAAHLARIFYRMLTHGQAWVDHGAREHENRRQEREKRSLLRRAAALGYRLEPAA
jgi:transposase